MLGLASTTLFLIQNVVAEVNALATNVDVPGPLNERPDVAIALATETSKTHSSSSCCHDDSNLHPYLRACLLLIDRPVQRITGHETWCRSIDDQ